MTPVFKRLYEVKLYIESIYGRDDAMRILKLNPNAKYFYDFVDNVISIKMFIFHEKSEKN